MPSTAAESAQQSLQIKDESVSVKSKKVLEVGSLARRVRSQTQEVREPAALLQVPSLNADDDEDHDDEDVETHSGYPEPAPLPSVNPRRTQQRMLAAQASKKGGFVGGLRASINSINSGLPTALPPSPPKSNDSEEFESESEDETDEEEHDDSSSGRSESPSSGSQVRPTPSADAPRRLATLKPAALSSSAKNLLNMQTSPLASLGGSAKSLFDRAPLPSCPSPKTEANLGPSPDEENQSSSSSDDASSESVCDHNPKALLLRKRGAPDRI